MCGIAGFVLARPDGHPDRRVLERMAERVGHRGDDVTLVLHGPAALGVCRQRVSDLEGDRPPMSGEDGTISVLIHGEIYNVRELGKRFTAAGHAGRTCSDVEAIVHAWDARGAEALHDLEGVFSLAVWDDRMRTLVLARDRLGVKPLYYALRPDGLIFASELTAMLAHPAIAREIDVESVSAYLAHKWVPAPRSMVKDVRKLPPGQRLVYANGEARVERWWDVRYDGPEPVVEVQAAARLSAVLDLAIRQHLVGDGPRGVLLSGGLDATVVAMFARRHVSRLRTFSVSFDGDAADERTDARRVAAVLDTEHHEEVVGGEAVLDCIAALGDIMDEPVGDASIVPAYLLSRLARGAVGLALSGDGGDELFAGHPVYRAHKLVQTWARLPRAARLVARAAVARLPRAHDIVGIESGLDRFMMGAELDLDTRHAVWTGCFPPEEQRALLRPAALARMPAAPSYAEWRRLASAAPSGPWLHRILYMDLRGSLAETVLPMMNRVSITSSLQLRAPLLDRRVVEVSAGLPADMKLRGLTTKHVLKWLVRHRLPADIVRRPAPACRVPMARWLRTQLRPLVEEVCQPAGLESAGLLDADAVSRLVGEHTRGEADHGRKLYTLLVLLLWMRQQRVQ